jgi:predicted porin
MNKTYLALAAIAVASAAHAQSSVTAFGVVDATLEHGSGSVASKTQLGTSGYNGSRIGFRGVEDLGGGLSASFWLEAGISNDNGTGSATNLNNQASGGPLAGLGGGQGLTFNRRSTVSVSGNWGELRIGRDYTPQYWSHAVFDPFFTNGAGASQVFFSELSNVGYTGGSTSVVVRASNSFAYLLPSNIGGFYGWFQHYLGENASNSATPDDGTGSALRIGYAKGPFDVALALSKTKYAAGNLTLNNIAGSWDFGAVKIMGVYSSDKIDAAAPLKGKGYLLGGTVPIGVSDIRFAYSQYKSTTAAAEPKSQKYAIGYDYNLSKRTIVYATYAHVKNSGGATQALNGSVTGANQSSTGYDLGIRHSF